MEKNIYLAEMAGGGVIKFLTKKTSVANKEHQHGFRATSRMKIFSGEYY